MKTFIIALSLLTSLSALAVPFRCNSVEKHENGKPIVTLKVNPKRNYVDTRGVTWRHFYLGFTPATGTPFSRFTAYGQGRAENEEISLTLIDRDFIIGTLSAKQEMGEIIMRGSLRLNKIKPGDIQVECVKE